MCILCTLRCRKLFLMRKCSQLHNTDAEVQNTLRCWLHNMDAERLPPTVAEPPRVVSEQAEKEKRHRPPGRQGATCRAGSFGALVLGWQPPRPCTRNRSKKGRRGTIHARPPGSRGTEALEQQTGSSQAAFH
ncbi:hypothetical protein NN561_018098 [Cricetulus griseus]